MSNWQQELINGFSHSKDLLDYLEIDAAVAAELAEQVFKTKVTRTFANRMQKGNLHDPLLRQVLAVSQELDITPGLSKDPLQEKSFNPIPGLIHKYQSRVLLMLSGACAIHCRYCFRRHFPYQANTPGKSGVKQIVAYLLDHPDVNEIILSGGDPMILNNDFFRYLLDELSQVPHIQFFRIHSRIPVVLPSRIESEWLSLWQNRPWQKVMVTHINHAQEINTEVSDVVRQLKYHGWQVLNQAVLLADVNDNLDAQVALSHQLIKSSIIPYYLHLLGGKPLQFSNA